MLKNLYIITGPYGSGRHSVADGLMSRRGYTKILECGIRREAARKVDLCVVDPTQLLFITQNWNHDKPFKVVCLHSDSEECAKRLEEAGWDHVDVNVRIQCDEKVIRTALLLSDVAFANHGDLETVIGQIENYIDYCEK